MTSSLVRYLGYFATVLSLISHPTILYAETSIEYVPRIDIFEKDSMREIYLRLGLDHSATFDQSNPGISNFRIRIEGFLSHDFAEQEKRPLGQPDFRKSREEADLNEAWFDLGFTNGLGIRIGRQPIRWSQSWTLPSLDLLSGRRLNRFFLDPLIDQLTHPDAVRLTYSGELNGHTWDLDLAQVLQSAPFRFAEPLKNQDRENLGETAAKLGTKFGLLEFAVVGSTKKVSGTDRRQIQSGILLSYAFENVVVKTEAGNSDRDAMFATFGTDWFIDQWIIGPQLTVFRDPHLGNSGEALIYIPVRYSKDFWSVETDILLGFGNVQASDDRFLSLRIGRELKEGLVLSAGVQNYDGQTGRLLGQAKSILSETVYGFRIEYTGGSIL